MAEAAKAGFFARLKQGLSKTSASLGEGMASLFLGRKAIDDDLLDEIETRLLTADVGVEATTAIVQSLTQKVARKQLADSDALYKALQDELAALLAGRAALRIDAGKRPYVILVVGVNGVGKTTTIGKLARSCSSKARRSCSPPATLSAPQPLSSCRSGASATTSPSSPSTPVPIPPRLSSMPCRPPRPVASTC